MQGKIFSVLTTIMVAVIICQLSGCSAIIGGLSLGGDIASKKKDAAMEKQAMEKQAMEKRMIILPSEWNTIKPGTPINILLRSGARVRGIYLELVLVPAEEYAASYAKCREQIKEGIVLPDLGETVTVITKTGKQHEFEFLGFDYGATFFRFEMMGKTRTAKEDLMLIKNIMDSHGNIIGVGTVRKLISEGKISLLSTGIIIKSKAGGAQIAWEDIYLIQPKKKSVLLAVGLIVPIAAFMLYAMISSIFKISIG